LRSSNSLANLKDRFYNALRVVAKRYREPVLKETRRMEGRKQG